MMRQWLSFIKPKQGHRSLTDVAARVIHAQQIIRNCSDTALRHESRRLEFDFQAGQTNDQTYPMAFALVREATRRTFGFEHFPVQLYGGYQLMHRSIVEMDTGEGKTLTALLPLYLHSLMGRGVFLSTANDYLAQRDAQEMRPILERLGRTIGVIQSCMTDDDRRSNYRCDITYGTASEFGFDILRDRMKRRSGQEQLCVGRSRLYAMIVDEADSLLIDEASTPLVVASSPPAMEPSIEQAFRWAAAHAKAGRESLHFDYAKGQDKITLTKEGRLWVQQVSARSDLNQLSLLDCYEYMERAIKVLRNFHRDQHYVVSADHIRLVDEHTGRFAVGREWHDGIQQAIQAKEGVPLSMPSGPLGRMTLQTFFVSFEHLSGMSGTIRHSAYEFRKVYQLCYVNIPPHRKNLRQRWPQLVFNSEQEKFRAIAAEAVAQIQVGRSVLIGTRSIAASERLSRQLRDLGVQHQILNATQSEHEATIISQAGQAGRVTIATNMAGRGTDIKVSAAVRAAGGMHVIVSELHDSPRIDRQLIGRTARQGDPGSYRIFASDEDEILRIAAGLHRGDESSASSLTASTRISAQQISFAQRQVEKRNEIRRRTMFTQEKKRLQQLQQSGFDPLLDIVE